jgi:hypothetical protein
MNTRTIPGWVLGIILAGGALVPGVTPAATEPSSTADSPEKTGAAIASPVITAPATLAPLPDAASEPSPTAAAAPDHPAANPPPAIISWSPWFYEVERLAKAGIEDGVVQTYINNSAGTFNLTADQVIYLKNLGLPYAVKLSDPIIIFRLPTFTVPYW